jgi:glucose/arabinose dehydrogenase
VRRYVDRGELAQLPGDKGGKVVRESRATARQGRPRARCAPETDGLIYVLTEGSNGKLIRLLPAGWCSAERSKNRCNL